MIELLFFFTLTITGLLAAGFVYTRWWEKQAPAHYPPRGQFIKVKGIRLHYLRKGRGSPVVLLHGSFATLNYFTFSIFDRLAEEFDVTVLEQPGYGYSERPDQAMSLEDHADYLREALRELGIEKPVLAAHSWGAGVALAYAIQYPSGAAALVFLNGYVRPSDGPVELLYRLPAYPVIGKIFLHCLLAPIGKIQAPYRTRNSFAPNAAAEDYARVIEAFTLRPENFAHNAEDVRHCSPSLRRLLTRFDKIQAPLYILTGDKDCVSQKEYHADWLKERLPQSEITVFPETGHMIAFAWPDKTLEFIRRAAAASKGQPA